MRTLDWRKHLSVLFVGMLISSGLIGAWRPVALDPPGAPPASAHPADVAVAWYNMTLDLVQSTPGYTPPVAARALGYMGVTLYEAVRPGMAGYRSLAGQLNELKALPGIDPSERYHWPSTANHALAALARQLFPTAQEDKLAAIDRLEKDIARQFQRDVDKATLQRSLQWGEDVAQAIFSWSRGDGGHEGYLTNFPKDYVPPSGFGMWVKTPPAFLDPLQPYWGENRPFVLDSGADCPAPAPPAYSENIGSDFYREAYEVYETVSRRDPLEVTIAHFWADDPGRTFTPPGHWVSILGQVLAKEQAGLDEAAVAYAKLGIAVADAFITCWHTKYIYHVPRPITYIHNVIDPAWNDEEVTDPVTTPPFPEYTSGHSVQSGAAAAVLTDLFGEHYAFTDHTNDYLGLAPRSFGSFAEAADEAARSRLYGGIHYRSSIEQGLKQGRCVGERVLSLVFKQ